jgi:nucleoside 2-deoxyribosyltransferase
MSTKIAIAGSMSSIEAMRRTSAALTSAGAYVGYPETDERVKSATPEQMTVLVTEFNEIARDRIAQSDLLLVVNEAQNGIAGFVGPNTSIEIGMAFALKKPIYLLHDIPANQPITEELEALVAGVAGPDLTAWLDSIQHDKETV